MADNDDVLDIERVTEELEKFEKQSKDAASEESSNGSQEEGEGVPSAPPSMLDKFLMSVAKTGDPVLPWLKIKHYIRHKIDMILSNFNDKYGTGDIESQNIPPYNYFQAKEILLQHFDTFTGAPFTIQRICEILIDPGQHYKRTDKLLRGLEKNILVVSTVGRISVECSNPQQRSMLFNGLQMTNFRAFRSPLPQHGKLHGSSEDVPLSVEDEVGGAVGPAGVCSSGRLNGEDNELLDDDEASFEDECLKHGIDEEEDLDDMEGGARPRFVASSNQGEYEDEEEEEVMDGYVGAGPGLVVGGSVGSVINMRRKRKQDHHRQQQNIQAKRIRMEHMLRSSEQHEDELMEHDGMEDGNNIVNQEEVVDEKTEDVDEEADICVETTTTPLSSNPEKSMDVDEDSSSTSEKKICSSGGGIVRRLKSTDEIEVMIEEQSKSLAESEVASSSGITKEKPPVTDEDYVDKSDNIEQADTDDKSNSTGLSIATTVADSEELSETEKSTDALEESNDTKSIEGESSDDTIDQDSSCSSEDKKSSPLSEETDSKDQTIASSSVTKLIDPCEEGQAQTKGDEVSPLKSVADTSDSTTRLSAVSSEEEEEESQDSVESAPKSDDVVSKTDEDDSSKSSSAESESKLTDVDGESESKEESSTTSDNQSSAEDSSSKSEDSDADSGKELIVPESGEASKDPENEVDQSVGEETVKADSTLDTKLE